MRAETTALLDDLPPAHDPCIRRPLRTLLPLLKFGGQHAHAAAPVGTGGRDSACELIEHSAADRASVERFISRCFERSFGSQIKAFMPRLFSLRNGDGDIVGAFGLRSASHRLYLEQYLDQPIEHSIRTATGGFVERKAIVEVGHFSGSAPGSVRTMIFLLTENLQRQGYEWVAFTGTSTLRNAFRRLGLAPIDVCAAAPDRLPPQERAVWGSYYDHAPRVLVGNVGQGYRALLPTANPLGARR
jgi:hypothetical protein